MRLCDTLIQFLSACDWGELDHIPANSWHLPQSPFRNKKTTFLQYRTLILTKLKPSDVTSEARKSQQGLDQMSDQEAERERERWKRFDNEGELKRTKGELENGKDLRTYNVRSRDCTCHSWRSCSHLLFLWTGNCTSHRELRNNLQSNFWH